jgi:hypothetical protein
MFNLHNLLLDAGFAFIFSSVIVMSKEHARSAGIPAGWVEVSVPQWVRRVFFGRENLVEGGRQWNSVHSE